MPSLISCVPSDVTELSVCIRLFATSMTTSVTAPVVAHSRANCRRADDLRAIDGEIQAVGIGAAIVLSPHPPIRAAIIDQPAICCADRRAAGWRPCSVHADFHHGRPGRIGSANCRSREQQRCRCDPDYASADHAIHRVSPADVVAVEVPTPRAPPPYQTFPQDGDRNGVDVGLGL